MRTNHYNRRLTLALQEQKHSKNKEKMQKIKSFSFYIPFYQKHSKYILHSKRKLLKESKDLIKKGMKFVGPVIIYSYLQAIGIVNAHTKECYLYKEE